MRFRELTEEEVQKTEKHVEDQDMFGHTATFAGMIIDDLKKLEPSSVCMAAIRLAERISRDNEYLQNQGYKISKE